MTELVATQPSGKNDKADRLGCDADGQQARRGDIQADRRKALYHHIDKILLPGHFRIFAPDGASYIPPSALGNNDKEKRNRIGIGGRRLTGERRYLGPPDGNARAPDAIGSRNSVAATRCHGRRLRRDRAWRSLILLTADSRHALLQGPANLTRQALLDIAHLASRQLAMSSAACHQQQTGKW